jgi:formylglycine-generating enzyme required for sulfatase activity
MFPSAALLQPISNAKAIAPDPRALDRTQTTRILRGGSWFYYPGNCRSACRSNVNAVNRLNDIGFRICCAAPQKQATTPKASYLF